MDSGLPKCRRCLLEEMQEDELYKNLREVIDAIPAELKAPRDIYMKRLDTCRACDRLVSGMCVLCGCYVEMRAAKNAQRCPDGKW
jgi:radical SAM superfamily enzyme with C-terminal helix-hairpin-helix motif